MLTGSVMVLSCFAYGIIILNDPKMKIPFANPIDQAVFIDPQFGWPWWLTLFTGIGLIVLGFVILLLDFFLPRKIAVVFHHSVVEEDEFFVVSELKLLVVHTLQFILVLLVIVCRRRMMILKKLERGRSTAELVCVQGPPAEAGQLAADEPHAVESVACVRRSVNNGAPCVPTAVALSVLPKRVASRSQISGQGTLECSIKPGLNCGL